MGEGKCQVPPLARVRKKEGPVGVSRWEGEGQAGYYCYPSTFRCFFRPASAAMTPWKVRTSCSVMPQR